MHVDRLLTGEETLDLVLTSKVDFLPCTRQDPGVAPDLQGADDGRADQSAMPGDENGGGSIDMVHGLFVVRLSFEAVALQHGIATSFFKIMNHHLVA